MECFGFVLAALGLGILLAPLVAAGVSLVRGREARRRIEALEKEVGELRTAVRNLARSSVVTAPPPPPLTAQAPAEPDVAARVDAAAVPEPPEEPLPSPAPPVPEPVAARFEDEPEPVAAPEPASPVPSIDWERWVGVRGAAVLGGVVLALAALLFLRYSIEHGLIPPVVRVTIAFALGIGAIVAAERMRPRGYATTANALAGAGAVILYGATWAARELYELIPAVVAWGLMILVTAACCLLAWRHRSLVVAVLGLVGGFTTPLLLTTGSDRPIGLFTYVLLLDLALLWLGRRNGWTALVWLCLGATAFYQAGWIFDRMGADRTLLGLAILGVFAGLFAFAPAAPGRRDGARDPLPPPDPAPRVAALLLPFAFALYFAGSAELGPHVAPLAGLLALLSAAALWLEPRLGVAHLGLGVAAADLAVLAVWISRSRFDDALAWEAAAVLVGLALPFHVAAEVEARRRRGDEVAPPSASPLVATLGLGLLGILATTRSEPLLWPWLTAAAVLALLLLRQAARCDDPVRAPVGAGLLALTFAAFFPRHLGEPAFPSPELFCALLVAAAVALQVPSLRAAQPLLRRHLDAGAALFATLALAAFVVEAVTVEPATGPALFHGTTILLALLAISAATRLGSGPAFAVAAALLAAVHSAWTFSADLADRPDVALLALLFQGGAVIVLTWWPLLAQRRLATEPVAWWAAALAGPAWFRSLERLWEIRFGDAAIGLLPVLLATVALVAAFGAGRLGAEASRRRGLVWFLAVTLGFVSLAIPLQLEREWVTIGWALDGLAMLVLWRRLRHPGLRLFGLALLAAATARLLVNPALLAYHPPSATPIFNWLMYTYMVPAAALVASARLLARGEAAEAAEVAEADAGATPRAGAAGLRTTPVRASAACGLAAIALVFAWINLTILDAFATGPRLVLHWERDPARDLTLSLAWAVFALLLLALGMRRREIALRWVSLVFLVLTIGKVFLYDLGELTDLWRVASLVGLAFSLLAVSLAYQRFVFREKTT